MKKKAVLALAMLTSSMVFFSAVSAADDVELMEMQDAVVAAGGDWAAIEDLLLTLTPEDRQLVIDTYPERIAELEEIQKSITEAGVNWTAGLNSVSILPPEMRPGTGAFPLPAEAGGVPREIVTIGPSEGVPAALALPTSWDWRSVSGNDWTTPIKNQGACGSCWAFGALAAIESRVKLAGDNPGLVPDFSEQYLVSCSPGSCGGGFSDITADWIMCEGTVDEACFPYVALDTVPCYDSCFDRESRDYRDEGWYWVCDNWYTVDVDRIKQEVFSGGPVSTFMWVYDDFQYYTGGYIYEHTYGTEATGHMVDIVGWGNTGGVDYWICKNSWGTGWGEFGWFRIKMGEVDIGTQAIAYQPKIRGKVLFYEGHVPDFDFELLDRYSEWGNILASNGYLVHSTTTTPLTLDLLECYDVVITSNPTTSFASSELDDIKEFVGRGRVIASGDGDLFDIYSIYLQDNERMAVEYVDWLATGEGKGLLVMGERQEPNTAANQIANMFGLNFNEDIISDPKRYDTDTYWPILGPEDDVEVLASCSLDISKDAFSLARATSSGYVSAALATGDDSETAASYEMIEGDLAPENPTVEEAFEVEVEITPEELELVVMADTSAAEMPSEDLGAKAAGYDIAPEDMPPEDESSLAPEDLGAGVEMTIPSVDASLSFTGPIGIAAIDLGRKGEDTVGVFRPSTRTWFLDYDNDGVPDKIIGFGTSGDLLASGDWNGNGKDTIGVFRPSTGTWYLDYDNNGAVDKVVTFGLSGDLPVSGDWNGDGTDTIGVFRSTTRTWYLDYDNDGLPNKVLAFGLNDDLPVSGDWNGDGTDTIGVFRPSTKTWYLDYNNDRVADKILAYGLNGDLPVSGDWNGDGRDTIGVFRPSTKTWYLDYNNDRVADKILAYGLNGDKPVSGDWYQN